MEEFASIAHRLMPVVVMLSPLLEVSLGDRSCRFLCLEGFSLFFFLNLDIWFKQESNSSTLQFSLFVRVFSFFFLNLDI